MMLFVDCTAGSSQVNHRYGFRILRYFSSVGIKKAWLNLSCRSNSCTGNSKDSVRPGWDEGSLLEEET